jgi:hypothetical protein
MLAVFTKPIESVTAEDAAELHTQAWPEGYTVEFKRTLPHRKGGDDGWISGASLIGDFARDEILAEVIAFANSQGGTLVLGIDETKDKPPRAAAISALPRVGELARRFEDAARSCIDPPLPRLQVRAIETEPEKGVVIFRTGSSLSAPHRLTTTLESYARHGSSTLRMTMREIQDMTINVAHGMASVDATFAARREAFVQWGTQRSRASQFGAFRVTAIPLELLPDPGRLSDQPNLFPHPRNFSVVVQQQEVGVGLNVHSWNERPIVRGVARYADTDAGGFRQELHQSGVTDIWMGRLPRKIGSRPADDPGQLLLWHVHVTGAVLQAMFLADLFRRQVGVPEAEYALELEIKRFGLTTAEFIYTGFLDGNFGDDRYLIEEPALMFPRIPVSGRSEFSTIIDTVDVDVFDALGVRRSGRTPITVRI